MHKISQRLDPFYVLLGFAQSKTPLQIGSAWWNKKIKMYVSMYLFAIVKKSLRFTILFNEMQ